MFLSCLCPIPNKRINNAFIQQIFVEYLLCSRCFARCISYKNRLDNGFCLQGTHGHSYLERGYIQSAHVIWNGATLKKNDLGCAGLIAWALFLALGSNLRMCGIPEEQLHTIFWNDESGASVFPDLQQWLSLRRRAKLFLFWLVLLGTLFYRILERNFQIFLLFLKKGDMEK